MGKPEIEAALLALPLDERIEVAEHLWESIERESEGGDLPQWQVQLLEERLAYADRNPDDWLTREQVEAALNASSSRSLK
jgi:putative addiction module component (TIGR02574 family)